jgi:methylmalonyl-CoA mutase N-terminal domain/subunit
MYRRKLWTMRQYAGFGTAQETNYRFRQLLDAGQTGLSVAFDLPTQMGYDSDHPRAGAEVGRAGVAIDTVEDLAVVFDQIPLDEVSTSMTINATAAILLAMYTVVAEERGIPANKLRGTVQNDVLKEYVARGTYIYPLESSLRLVTDIFTFVTGNEIPFNPISVSGYHMREAGATAVQEVAFTFANAIEYLDRAVGCGLSIDTIAPRISFFFAAHNDLFEEVAKFRAARRLWARLVRDRYQGGDKSCRLRFHTQTGGSTLTAQQPLNNVVRVAIQALASVLGGTQSLHTNGYDEALALPTEEAREGGAGAAPAGCRARRRSSRDRGGLFSGCDRQGGSPAPARARAPRHGGRRSESLPGGRESPENPGSRLLGAGTATTCPGSGSQSSAS